MQIQKTNAARLLDAAGIPYTLVPYEVDEEHLEASHVAEQLGEDLDRVLVAARISGNKSCAMIHVKELLPLTGYIRGGCSPIGMKKPFPTFIHESALLWDTIYISAGVRGLQICIEPQALIGFVGAGIYPL